MFAVKLNERLMFSDSFLSLADRDKSVFLSTLFLIQPGHTYVTEIERLVSYKVMPSIIKLCDADLLRCDEAGRITLNESWAFSDRSSSRVAKYRAKKKAEQFKQIKSEEYIIETQHEGHTEEVENEFKDAYMPTDDILESLESINLLDSLLDDEIDPWSVDEFSAPPINISELLDQSKALLDTDAEFFARIEDAPLSKPKKPKKIKKTVDDDLPEWMPIEVWKEWLDYRVSKKNPMTDIAKRKFINLATSIRERGHDVFKLMDASIIGGYPTIYDPDQSRFSSFSAQKSSAQKVERKRNGGVVL